jgi:hypothetical protein
VFLQIFNLTHMLTLKRIIPRTSLLFLLLIGSVYMTYGQFSLEARDTIAKYTRIDYLMMLDQLGLQESDLRPGPSGNPQAPNAANRFEDMVNNYTLPDPLLLNNGKRVEDEETWWQSRRPEIVQDFENSVYGHLPDQIPEVTWQLVSMTDTSVGKFPVREKILRGIVDNSSFPSIRVEIELLIGLPPDARDALPIVLEFGFIHNPFNPDPIKPIGLGSPCELTWKEQLLSAGWGYAIIVPSSIQADNGAGLTRGIIGLVNQGKPRKPDDWGALRAWAWGASRAIDYFETDPGVDENRIAIEGLSRYGKAALVAMAFDSRISLGFIGSSGAGGAKILRRVFGEQVENLASTYAYHWFCGNFIHYASTLTPDDLPVDAHELVALCAPRPVFIRAGSPYLEGHWIDAKGMFLAGLHAGPVYRLLGKGDLGTSEFPTLGTAITDGEIAFRQHAGGHSSGPNWSTWIAWACRYWGDCIYYKE